MYFVSGCNLFGQWFSSDFVFWGFKNVAVSENVLEAFKFKPKRVKLLEINWSYNIFQIDESYYITGSWLGKDNQFLKFDLPEECRKNTDRKGLKNFTIIGNDYNLILINKETYDIWIINLEENDDIKKLKLNIEAPPPRPDKKRSRFHDKVAKAVVTNNNCLYLTENGTLYSGFMPTYLNISFAHKEKICDIVSGYDHFIMLTETGRVYTWGNGRRLQLGHGDLTDLKSPTEVEALAGLKIKKIAAGGWHSLALSEFGDLYAWGWNDTGQLGIKTQPDNPQGVLRSEGLQSYPTPTLVDFFNENDEEVHLSVKDIACGSRHSVVILKDNSVWTSGNNKYGQLGFDPEVHSNVNYFKKVFQCKERLKLKCGLWTTVLLKEE